MRKIKQIFITDKKQIMFRALALIIFALIILIDRLTKTYLYGPNGGRANLILIGINLNWTLNTGVAFSSFLGFTAIFQTAGIILLLVALLGIFVKIELKYWIPFFIIASGGFGNVIDRFMYANGGVRDFITFPWWNKFAIFNFADSVVVLSTITLLITMLITLIRS